MPNHVVCPVHLGTFHNAEYSHFVLNTRFGEKFDAASLSYLIRGEETLLVVDTGFRRPPEGTDLRGDAEAAYAAKLAELGQSFDDVTHIVLTHLHWDHMRVSRAFDAGLSGPVSLLLAPRATVSRSPDRGRCSCAHLASTSVFTH